MKIIERNITFGENYTTAMKLFTILTTILISTITWGQLSLEVGQKIKFGKLTLSNDQVLEFYNLEYGSDERITFINTESLQPEFLYLSSVKSIANEEQSVGRILEIEKSLNPVKPIVENTFTTIELKDKKIELKNPSEGKAVVYFVRTSSSGFLINFRHFDKDKFIGKFAGAGFIRHECDPGEHAFWVGASNSSYVTANLEAGKIYVIETIPTMGIAYAQVKIEVPQKSDEKKYQKHKKRVFAILSNPEFDRSPSAEDLAKQEDYKKEIENGLEIYSKRVNKEQDHLLNADQHFE